MRKRGRVRKREIDRKRARAQERERERESEREGTVRERDKCAQQSRRVLRLGFSPVMVVLQF